MQMIKWQDLGVRIADIRIQRGVTSGKGAERLGISRTTLHHYEQGERPIPSNVMTTFMEAYSVEPNNLFGVNTYERFFDLFSAFVAARDAYEVFEQKGVGWSQATSSDRADIRATGERLYEISGTVGMRAAIRAFFPQEPERTLRAGDELNHLWSGIGNWVA